MADIEEKKKIPKTTLIKHRHVEPVQEKQPDKKKVVVVKKRVVIKKKPKVVVKADQAEKRIETAEKPLQVESTRVKEPITQKPVKAEEPRGRGRVRQEPPRDGAPRTFKRPERPVVGVTAPVKEKKEEVKKAPGKKFFKTKRKGDYRKKKPEKHLEKDIPVKRKQAARSQPVPKEISIMEVITVAELAKKMNLKASELIAKLIEMGMMVTINQQIDAETAEILAEEYGAKVNIVSLYDETKIIGDEEGTQDMRARPPIVTIMGHVDHGKTKLLDAIRTSNVVDQEYGGITQHIGAYSVDLKQAKIVFLDTPGHEAFTLMRARGAQITDIVVLVVAADDGVMPQTVEAIDHAKEANVPIIVAVNKIDLPDANVERVKQQISEYDLVPEEWGGSTLYCEISALKKQGIEELLESVLLQAEILELHADVGCRPIGKILESKIDLGRGIVATVIMEKGVLRVGDSFVAGVYSGRVRAMFSDRGEKMTSAGPAIPAEILGFTGIPNAGDPFQVTVSEKTARQVGAKRQELKKLEEAKNVKKITLDNLYEQIKLGEMQEFKVIIKGDVHGSVEALQTALERLSNEEIRLDVIRAAAGSINESDVMLASASNAIIIGFHVRPIPSAQALAEQEKVEIRKYNVIYESVEDIKAAMEGLLKPVLKEEAIGMAEIRDLFRIPRAGTIAGCYIRSGKIRRGASVLLIRDGVEIYKGKVSSLKRFKDDVREVEEGFECGIGIENYNDMKVGDTIEAFEIIELAKTLSSRPARESASGSASGSAAASAAESAASSARDEPTASTNTLAQELDDKHEGGSEDGGGKSQEN